MIIRNNNILTKCLEKYFFLDNRVASFKTWIFPEGSCSGYEMAKAGFYMTALSSAKCFFCEKELDGWEITDIPLIEHESHCSDCPYVNFVKTNTGVITVKDALTLKFESILYKLNKIVEVID